MLSVGAIQRGNEWLPAGIVAVALAIAGCSSGSSSDDDSADTEETTDTPATVEQLRAESGIMQVTLEWEASGPVNILYSTDAQCDWSNYSLCDNAGQLTQLDGGSHKILVEDEDVTPSLSYFFMPEHPDDAVSPQGATFSPPVPTGPISKTLPAGDDILLVGTFDRIALQANASAVVDIDREAPAGALPLFDGRAEIFDVTPDGDGGWFIGGEFLHIAGVERKNLAHLQPNGALNTQWQPSAGLPDSDEHIRALAPEGDRLITGGVFSVLGGSANRDSLGAIDQASGDILSWSPGVRIDSSNAGIVHDIAVHDGMVYVAGEFDQVRSHGDTTWHDQTGLARFTADTGVFDESWSPDPNGVVHAVTVDNDRVYLGGDFDDVQGDTERANLTAVDHDHGTPVPDWTPRPDDSVLALLLDGADVYAAGTFEQLSGDDRIGIVKLNRTNGTTRVGFRNALIPLVESRGLRSIELVDDQLFVGGTTLMHPDQELRIERGSVAALDPDTGDLLDWNAGTGIGTVNSLSESQGNLFMGGNFAGVAGKTRRSVAFLDPETGRLREDQLEIFGAIHDVAADPTSEGFYIGGNFLEVEGEQRLNIARFNLLDTGPTLDPNWNPGIDGMVLAVGADEFRVYAGGIFESVGGGDGQQENDMYFAQFEHGSGEVLTTNVQFNADSSPAITAIERHGAHVYVGGTFDDAFQSDDVCNLMRFHADADGYPDGDWQPCLHNESTAPNSNTQIRDLAFTADHIIAGGVFNEIRISGETGHCDNGADCAEFDGNLAALRLSDAGAVKDWNPNTTYVHTNGVATDAAGNVYAAGDGSAEVEGQPHAISRFLQEGASYEHDEGWGLSDGFGGSLDHHSGRLWVHPNFIELLDADPANQLRSRLAVIDPETGEYVW